MKYSLRRKIEEVVLEMQDGSEDKLELREMVASERDAYLDRLRGRVRLDPQGRNSGIKSFEGLQADLISSCLFRGNAKVGITEIQAWPASVVADIWKKAQALNKLDTDAEQLEAESKNG